MEPKRRPRVQDGVDDEDPQAVRAEGYDPDDPAVVAAIDIVRWELSLLATVTASSCRPRSFRGQPITVVVKAPRAEIAQFQLAKAMCCR